VISVGSGEPVAVAEPAAGSVPPNARSASPSQRALNGSSASARLAARRSAVMSSCPASTNASCAQALLS
jgi:hypothetical protein